MRRIKTFIIVFLLVISPSFSAPTERSYHYWYSEEQAKIMYQINGCDLVCTIKGQAYFYSEAQESYKKSNWKDAKYLGYGTYAYCSKR